MHVIKEWREGIFNYCVVATASMDLSTTFDCIPHNLIIAKMTAYGFKFNDLKLTFSYAKGWEQGVKINNI